MPTKPPVATVSPERMSCAASCADLILPAWAQAGSPAPEAVS
jgi:hypothetical protein